jgi:hypothetical protein
MDAQLEIMLEFQSMKTLFLFLSISLVFSSSAISQVDPKIHWGLIRLPHFDLIFDAEHQELASAYATHLEKIVKTLGGIFSEVPEKTLIVLNDRTDLTNGYATPIPTSTIVVFPVLPGPLESIYEHGDWPKELIMHEYTHVLSFEPRRGVVRVLHNIFGSIITPNILLPRWWLEGVAVEMETRQSPFGRLRSSSQESALRSYLVDESLDSIDLGQINESTIPTWPGGARPYLFGSLMWSHMVAEKKTELIETLHQRYGGRVPYAINTPIQDELGKNYTDVFLEMMQDLNLRLGGQLAQLKKIEPHRSAKFESKALEAFSPSISPDGLKMIYLVKDDTTKRSIRLLKRPSAEVRFSEDQEVGKVTQRLTEESENLKPIPERVQESPEDDGPPTGTISRLSWFSDSNKFMFDRVAEYNHFHETSDLWIYNIDKLKAEPLTQGLRAREPAVSPSGADAVFVKLGPGSTQIAKIRIADKKVDILYSPELLATVSFPTYLNSNEIIFTERSKSGDEKILRMNLAEKLPSPVLTGFAQSRFATISENGLLFVSTKNRVPNLYLATADLKRASPQTHTLTGISVSTWDPFKKELYVTELTSKGNQLRILEKSEISRIEKDQLPTPSPLYGDRYPASFMHDTIAKQEQTAVNEINNTNYPVEEYSPYGHLWPQYWLPGLYIGNYGAFVSATTSGSDPVGLHAYSLSLGYDTASTDLTYNFLYSNQVWTPLLQVAAQDYKLSIPLTGFELRKKWQIFQSRWQLSQISTDFDLIAGWDWRSSEFTNSSKLYSTGPSLGVQYSDYSQAGAQISPESGQGFKLLDTSFLRDNSKEGFNELDFSAVKFFSKWLPTRHALMVRAQGKWIEDRISIANYVSTGSYLLNSNPLFPQYLMRGYRPGQFLAKSLVNYTVEYRMPLLKVYHGSGTTPLFVKQFHGAFVADGIQLDGFAYRDDLTNLTGFPFESVPKWKIFTDVGAELKADVTLGYHFPVTVYWGVYWPLDTQYQEVSPQYGIGLLL